MKSNKLRFKSAVTAMCLHFVATLLVAFIVAALVFGVWYPHPYRAMSGGTELFFLVIGVDIVCGPLLTLVLFNPTKPKREMVVDLGLVVIMQLTALSYGIWTVQQARPLYLVHEVDRFKVIALADIDVQELNNLPKILQIHLFKGPQTTGLREANKAEREIVMFESVQGGRDYGERPSFYAIYDATRALAAYQKAKPISDFVKKYPMKQSDINKLQLQLQGGDVGQLRYVPIIARQDWIAVLNPKGEIVGYMQGDGF